MRVRLAVARHHLVSVLFTGEDGSMTILTVILQRNNVPRTLSANSRSPVLDLLLSE